MTIDDLAFELSQDRWTVELLRDAFGKWYCTLRDFSYVPIHELRDAIRSEGSTALEALEAAADKGRLMSPEVAVSLQLQDTRFQVGHSFWDDFKAHGRTRKRGKAQKANK